MFRDAEQNRFGMVPGVPGGVVGRGGHAPVRKTLLPVRLPFEVRAVAGGAMPGVNSLAARDLLCIGGVRRRLPLLEQRDEDRAGEKRERCGQQPDADLVAYGGKGKHGVNMAYLYLREPVRCGCILCLTFLPEKKVRVLLCLFFA